MWDRMSLSKRHTDADQTEDYNDVYFIISPITAINARTEVLSMARRNNTATKELVGVIKKDKRLASDIIDAANCAYYGMKAPVRSLQHAIVLLGLLRLQDIAAGAWGL